jgi:hypothetical protein
MTDIFGDVTRAEMQQEIDRLRAEVARLTAELDEARRGARRLPTAATLRADLARANAERDEARRLLCMNEALDRLRRRTSDAPIQQSAFRRNSRRIAAERGWDCFDAKEVQP